MNGLGYDKFTARYLVRLKDAAATTLLPGTSPKAAWTLGKFVSDWVAVCARQPGSVWPLIGGSAAAHAVELFGHQDITWAGTVTHNANGMTGDGTSGYGAVGESVALFPNSNGWCFGFYCRTNSSVDAVYEMGSAVNGNKYAIAARNAGGAIYTYCGNSTVVSGASTNSLGLIWIIRRNNPAGNDIKGYPMRNAASLTGGSPVAVSGAPGSVFCIGCCNGIAYSPRNISFAFVTPYGGVDQNVMYPLVQALQTFLARQV